MVITATLTNSISQANGDTITITPSDSGIIFESSANPSSITLTGDGKSGTCTIASTTASSSVLTIRLAGTSCAIDTTASGLIITITGGIVQNAAAGGIKLDISPVAWQRIDAADVRGDVTFVYVRVR